MALQLKEARIQAGYSIDEIAKDLNIRKQYLTAIEEEDYSILPGKVYAEGYKKLYARYLGISLSNKQKDKVEERFFHIKIAGHENFKKYLIAICVVMLILIVTIYQLILQSGSRIDHISVIKDSNYNNNDINYTDESNE